MKQTSETPPGPSDNKSRLVGYYLLSRLFALLILLVVWGIFGLFIAFVCNGGAAGSSEMSGSAWTCLIIYTLIFVSVIPLWPGSLQSSPEDPSDEKTPADSLECYIPIERDVASIKLNHPVIYSSDEPNAKKVILIVIVLITLMLGFMI